MLQIPPKYDWFNPMSSITLVDENTRTILHTRIINLISNIYRLEHELIRCIDQRYSNKCVMKLEPLPRLVNIPFQYTIRSYFVLDRHITFTTSNDNL